MAMMLLAGCTALSNPVADSIPVSRVPPELLAAPKVHEETVALSFLGQEPPDVYRLAAGDTLGVVIEGILGEKSGPMSIQMAPPVQTGEQRKFAPSYGYPATIDEDGTLALPMVPPIKLQGKSLKEAREAIRKSYVENKIFAEGRERILVTMLQPRQYSIVIMRQEANAFNAGPAGATNIIATGKRGTGHNLTLPAYENDVLHALSQTGGLPGIDAINDVVIYRNRTRSNETGMEVIKVPLHVHPGEPLPKPSDVILQTGDVVMIEPRDRDVFFTGGLLPSGEFVLPRDRDLDVVEAVAQVRGPLLNAAFSPNNLAGNLIAPGIGNPSPSLLAVVRRTPTGQVAIRVDLNRALRDSRERILVKAGDVLVLQETPSEALARYATQTFANFSFTWQPIHSPFANGLLDISAPQQIPGRIGVTNFFTPP
jgi:protein involved in polysaccharide export with SLBB domain